MRFSVIGAGGWGTTFAEMLGKKGFEIMLWVHSKSSFDIITKERENKTYLSGVPLTHIGSFTMNLEEALSFADNIIIALPTQKIRETLKTCKPYGSKYVITLSKGIEISTLKRVSEIVQELWDLSEEEVFPLSGPNFSYEIAREMPAASVIGGRNKEKVEELQKLLSANYFRVYFSLDPVGVELGGALKNVYALACGISDGLGFGDSSKASVIVRSLAELVRLGVALGGEKETFFGLSGTGDLIATSFSKRSRNRWAGEQIGLGTDITQIESSTKEVIEGIYTLKAIYKLNTTLGLDLPIIEALNKIIYEHSSPLQEIKALMSRPFKQEIY